jgi:hypothetical protein
LKLDLVAIFLYFSARCELYLGRDVCAHASGRP